MTIDRFRTGRRHSFRYASSRVRASRYPQASPRVWAKSGGFSRSIVRASRRLQAAGFMLARRWRGTALLIGLAVVGCGDDAAAPVAGEEFQTTGADQILFDLRHNMTVRGVRQAVLLADTAFLYEDSAAVEIRQLHLTLFDEQGREAADLTALKGRLDTRTEAMVARGNVVLITQEGRRIETEELHFDPNADRIWSDVPTTLREDGTVVHGSGFTADAGLDDITVQDPTGRFEGVEVETR